MTPNVIQTRSNKEEPIRGSNMSKIKVTDSKIGPGIDLEIDPGVDLEINPGVDSKIDSEIAHLGDLVLRVRWTTSARIASSALIWIYRRVQNKQKARLKCLHS